MSRLSDAIAKYKSEHPDLSCEDIAEQMRISTAMLFKYMKDTATPRESTLALIAQGIGVDVEDLREKDDPESIPQEEETESDQPIEETESDQPEEEIESNQPEEETKTEVHIMIGERPNQISALTLREIALLYFFSINALNTSMETHEINAMADEFMDRIAKYIKREGGRTSHGTENL